MLLCKAPRLRMLNQKIGLNCRSQHPVLPEFGRFRWRTVLPPDLFSPPSPQLAHREHRQRAWRPPTVPTGRLNFRRITGALRIRRAQSLQMPPALHIPIGDLEARRSWKGRDCSFRMRVYRTFPPVAPRGKPIGPSP
jgi:hypothetical protein